MMEFARKCKWTPEEDQVLVEYVRKHGPKPVWSHMNALMGMQLKRDAKSCRLRWENHLRPGLKTGPLTKAEQKQIKQLQKKLGNKWAEIASLIGGRSDNTVKNWWNGKFRTRVRKTEQQKQKRKQQQQRAAAAPGVSGGRLKRQRTDSSEGSDAGGSSAMSSTQQSEEEAMDDDASSGSGSGSGSGCRVPRRPRSSRGKLLSPASSLYYSSGIDVVDSCKGTGRGALVTSSNGTPVKDEVELEEEDKGMGEEDREEGGGEADEDAEEVEEAEEEKSGWEPQGQSASMHEDDWSETGRSERAVGSGFEVDHLDEITGSGASTPCSTLLPAGVAEWEPRAERRLSNSWLSEPPRSERRLSNLWLWLEDRWDAGLQEKDSEEPGGAELAKGGQLSAHRLDDIGVKGSASIGEEASDLAAGQEVEVEWLAAPETPAGGPAAPEAVWDLPPLSFEQDNKVQIQKQTEPAAFQLFQDSDSSDWSNFDTSPAPTFSCATSHPRAYLEPPVSLLLPGVPGALEPFVNLVGADKLRLDIPPCGGALSSSSDEVDDMEHYEEVYALLGGFAGVDAAMPEALAC